MSCNCGKSCCTEKKHNTLSENIRVKLSTVLKEDLDSSDEQLIRAWIRSEVASILFDLYKKRSVWS